jgi:hypothetical protein
MNEEDLRDCFAMFAMIGLFTKGIGMTEESAKQCWDAADLMLENRKPETIGLPAIKRKVRTK